MKRPIYKTEAFHKYWAIRLLLSITASANRLGNRSMPLGPANEKARSPKTVLNLGFIY